MRSGTLGAPTIRSSQAPHRRSWRPSRPRIGSTLPSFCFPARAASTAKSTAKGSTGAGGFPALCGSREGSPFARDNVCDFRDDGAFEARLDQHFPLDAERQSRVESGGLRRPGSGLHARHEPIAAATHRPRSRGGRRRPEAYGASREPPRPVSGPVQASGALARRENIRGNFGCEAGRP